MYRLFSSSIKNYFEYNKGLDSARLRLCEPLRLLADPALFKEEKCLLSAKYDAAAALIDEIRWKSKTDRTLETISWELWGMGFYENYEEEPQGGDDASHRSKEDEVILEEQMRMVRMFLNSYLYWPKEQEMKNG